MCSGQPVIIYKLESVKNLQLEILYPNLFETRCLAEIRMRRLLSQKPKHWQETALSPHPPQIGYELIAQAGVTVLGILILAFSLKNIAQINNI
jgi:hypothetical protein